MIDLAATFIVVYCIAALVMALLWFAIGFAGGLLTLPLLVACLRNVLADEDVSWK